MILGGITVVKLGEHIKKCNSMIRHTTDMIDNIVDLLDSKDTVNRDYWISNLHKLNKSRAELCESLAVLTGLDGFDTNNELQSKTNKVELPDFTEFVIGNTDTGE